LDATTVPSTFVPLGNTTLPFFVTTGRLNTPVNRSPTSSRLALSCSVIVTVTLASCGAVSTGRTIGAGVSGVGTAALLAVVAGCAPGVADDPIGVALWEVVPSEFSVPDEADSGLELWWQPLNPVPKANAHIAAYLKILKDIYLSPGIEIDSTRLLCGCPRLGFAMS
jgi:hypothetical protein